MASRRGLNAAVAGVVTAVAVGVGVALEPVLPKTSTEDRAAVPDVPLSELKVYDITTTRTPFCHNISDSVVERAVGGPAVASEYSSGDETALEPGLNDISHEFGCVYTRGSTVARVWVFAAPVDEYDAGIMVRDESATVGCVPTGVLKYGVPGAVLDCTTPEARVLRAIGRIGDAWVHCELSTPLSPPDPKLVMRGQRWCAAAAYAMQ